MLSVSEAYSRAVNADARRTFHRVTIGGVLLDQNAAPKMTFNESVGSNLGVALGTSNSASLQLTLRDSAVIDYTDMLVEPESGIELSDGTIVWLPLGKFWVTDSSTSNDYKTVNLTCADGMYLMSGEYVSALTYPALVRDVAREIAKQAGVELVDLEEWPEIYIRKKPEKLSLRNAIGYVAGCCGKNAKFNRYGKLELAWYKDTGITIEREQQYLDGFTRLNDQPLNVNFEIKGEVEKYKVTIVSDDNGSVVASPGTNILEGDTVTLNIVPFYKYELASISATTTTGGSVTLWNNTSGNEYYFAQPDSDVTVTVRFRIADGSSSEVTNLNSAMICDGVSEASEPTTFAMPKSVGATVTMEYTNPLITSKMVDAITAVVQGVSYTPSKVKHRGNPALEAGDIVTVPDKNGDYHTVLIMQQTLTFGGGMNAVITCPGQTERKTNFSSTGALTT